MGGLHKERLREEFERVKLREVKTMGGDTMDGGTNKGDVKCTYRNQVQY